MTSLLVGFTNRRAIPNVMRSGHFHISNIQKKIALPRSFSPTSRLGPWSTVRTRELSEIFLADGYLEQRLEELLADMEEDATEDRMLWGAYGEWQTMEMAQDLIVHDYLAPKRRMYLGAQSVLPDAQPSEVTVRVGQITYDLDDSITR